MFTFILVHVLQLLLVKRLHTTEPVMLHSSSQVNPIQCYHRTNMTPLIVFKRTNEWNVAYGSHTELAEFSPILVCMRGEMPDFKPELHVFNEIHSPVLFFFLLFVCFLGGGGVV